MPTPPGDQGSRAKSQPVRPFNSRHEPFEAGRFESRTYQLVVEAQTWPFWLRYVSDQEIVLTIGAIGRDGDQAAHPEQSRWVAGQLDLPDDGMAYWYFDTIEALNLMVGRIGELESDQARAG